MGIQVVKATSWSLLQRVGTMAISFVANMILARLLNPTDFGTIGLILTFVSIADLFVDAGLGQSLIQKQNVNKGDLSTVFTTNFLLSILFFSAIFIIAPWVEAYMQTPHLSLFLRIEALTIILRSLYVVQNAMLNKQLNFKALATVNISGAMLSSLVAIIMAFCGLGIWSLIGKNIVMHLTFCVLYRSIACYDTPLYIDKKSFKQLFLFGWFVSLSSLVDVIYTNLASFMIGKRYAVDKLGYYTQAHNLKQIPVYSLSMVVSQVLFPMFAKKQDDRSLIMKSAQKIITLATSLIFPLMLCLVVVAEPLIAILYSEKWLPAVPYFRILCIAGLVNILIHINRSILMALGLSRTLFKVQILAISIGILLLFVALRYDVLVFIGSIALYSFINWLLVAIETGKSIGYSVFQQFKDISSSLLLAIITTIVSLYINNTISIESNIFSLIVNVTIYLGIYLLLNVILNTQAFRIVKSKYKQ